MDEGQLRRGSELDPREAEPGADEQERERARLRNPGQSDPGVREGALMRLPPLSSVAELPCRRAADR